MKKLSFDAGTRNLKGPESRIRIFKIRIFEKNTRIMTVKLTLTIEKSVIERAKYFAKKTGRSLSELIENYLETITQVSDEGSLSPKLRKITGVISLPENFDEKKELSEYFEKKHL
jgi:hypothetical protein